MTVLQQAAMAMISLVLIGMVWGAFLYGIYVKRQLKKGKILPAFQQYVELKTK